MSWRDPSTPLEALEQAIDMALLSSAKYAPGVVVAALPKATRAMLEQVTSDDALRLRAEFWRLTERR